MNSITIQFESWDQLADKLNAMEKDLRARRTQTVAAPQEEPPAKKPVASLPAQKAGEDVSTATPSTPTAEETSPSDISDDDLRAAGYQAGLKDKAAVKGLVHGYGVSALSQIPAEHRADALRRLKELAA